MALRPRRSILYMPGSNERALVKGRSLAADGFIFDLEDAVAPDAKNAARAQVVAALRAGAYEGREAAVRVNAPDSVWWREDIEAAASVGPDAILVPKISDAAAIRAAVQAMRAAGAPSRTQLWAMIETPRAILDVGQIAASAREADSPLTVFIIGTNDLARETRARQTPGRAPALAWLSAAVAAARAFGLDILDGVFSDISDLDGLRRECAQGRDFGFDGKTLIHPNQIAAANEIFGPSSQEIEEAASVVAAFDLPENAGRGAIALGGRMVERLHADMARRTLHLAGLIAARGM